MLRSRSPRAHLGSGIPTRDWWAAWSTVAINSFGGPAGQIAVMHDEIVVKRRWVGERRFLHALNYCMMLPGPEAQQLATYLGWLLRGPSGGLFAGSLFILPGFVSIMALSILFAVYGNVEWVTGLFFGISAAVVAVVASAVIRIGKRVIKNATMLAIALASFLAIFVFELPFPLIVGAAALVGLIGGRWRPDVFLVVTGEDEGATDDKSDILIGDHDGSGARPKFGRTVRVLGLGVGLWFVPILILVVALGPEAVLVRIGWFFSTAAVLTFGGAYSVLAYIAQEAVNSFGWLQPGEMISGLGMAETTPGPLIQVVQFVGFMGSYRDPGGLTQIQAGIAGALVATWVTFVPSFLWIFLGAPFIENLRGRASLTAALSTVTAAVVGVILNLAIWFGMFTLFGVVNEWRGFGVLIYRPEWRSIDWFALAVMAMAALAIFRLKYSILQVVIGAGIAGVAFEILVR